MRLFSFHTGCCCAAGTSGNRNDTDQRTCSLCGSCSDKISGSHCRCGSASTGDPLNSATHPCTYCGCFRKCCNCGLAHWTDTAGCSRPAHTSDCTTYCDGHHCWRCSCQDSSQCCTVRCMLIAAQCCSCVLHLALDAMGDFSKRWALIFRSTGASLQRYRQPDTFLRSMTLHRGAKRDLSGADCLVLYGSSAC